MQAQWRALEALYASGAARAIGVSNYCQACLACLAKASTVTPLVNQMEYHVGMGGDPAGLHSYCRARGIVVEGYSALAGGKVARGAAAAAAGAAHNKSAAQAGLRWVVQHGSPFVTRSANPVHLAEDLDVLSWNLTAAEMAALDGAAAPACYVEAPGGCCKAPAAPDAGPVAAPVAAPSAPSPETATIGPNARIWRDTAGHPLEAHGAGIIAVGATYYMVGTTRKAPPNMLSAGINMYSSTDLQHWTFERTVLRNTSLHVASGFAGPFRIERPKARRDSAELTFSDRARCIGTQLRPGSSFLLSAPRFLDRCCTTRTPTRSSCGSTSTTPSSRCA